MGVIAVTSALLPGLYEKVTLHKDFSNPATSIWTSAHLL
jgi:hypothetical protein